MTNEEFIAELNRREAIVRSKGNDLDLQTLKFLKEAK